MYFAGSRSPRNSTSPAVFACRPTSVRPNVDLPEPLSPTSPTTSRSAIASDTSSTACTICPRPSGKCFVTPRASISGAIACRRVAAGAARRRVFVMQPAARAMARGSTVERRRMLRLAERHRVRAAREVRAARRRREQIRRRAFDRPQALRATCPCSASRRASRRCTDARADRTHRRRVPCSTISPAYMTATSSAMRATTPRSCVISTIAMPTLRCSSFSRSRICAWIVTSSAVVGSSAISTCGLAGDRHGDHRALQHAARERERILLRAALRFGDVAPTAAAPRRAPRPTCASSRGAR